MKASRESYPTIGISRHNIDEIKPQQQDFMLVGKDIDFMVID